MVDPCSSLSSLTWLPPLPILIKDLLWDRRGYNHNLLFKRPGDFFLIENMQGPWVAVVPIVLGCGERGSVPV